MEHHSLAIPCVPMQEWKDTYTPAKALAEGTIFPELNKTFFMAPEDSNPVLNKMGEDPHMLFSQVCFALDDALLYLDTHPDDGKAREFYEKCLQKKKELLGEARCGCDCATRYQWEKKPLVWEGGHC